MGYSPDTPPDNGSPRVYFALGSSNSPGDEGELNLYGIKVSSVIALGGIALLGGLAGCGTESEPGTLNGIAVTGIMPGFTGWTPESQGSGQVPPGEIQIGSVKELKGNGTWTVQEDSDRFPNGYKLVRQNSDDGSTSVMYLPQGALREVNGVYIPVEGAQGMMWTGKLDGEEDLPGQLARIERSGFAGSKVIVNDHISPGSLQMLNSFLVDLDGEKGTGTLRFELPFSGGGPLIVEKVPLKTIQKYLEIGDENEVVKAFFAKVSKIESQKTQEAATNTPPATGTPVPAQTATPPHNPESAQSKSNTGTLQELPPQIDQMIKIVETYPLETAILGIAIFVLTTVAWLTLKDRRFNRDTIARQAQIMATQKETAESEQRAAESNRLATGKLEKVIGLTNNLGNAAAKLAETAGSAGDNARLTAQRVTDALIQNAIQAGQSSADALTTAENLRKQAQELYSDAVNARK